MTSKANDEVGFTTGTTAAGAAKLAVRSWLAGKPVLETTIDTPANRTFKISAHKCIVRPSFAAAAVIKNSGADPDITKGAEIFAIVRPAEATSVKGGAGVGLVTKPGLAVEVGESAINPVPRSQIEKAVNEEISYFYQHIGQNIAERQGRSDKSDRDIENNEGKYQGNKAQTDKRNLGFEVTIVIPKGKELAERTMNARLGIVGGLSVLGTTGIVRPMSSKAYQESLIAQISIARAMGYTSVVLVFGNIGKRFATGKLGMLEDAVIEVSNWPTMLASNCRKAGIKKVLLAGHISKILKVAAGLEETSHETRFATDIFLEYAGSKLDGSRDLLKSISGVNTTEEASIILNKTSEGREFIRKIATDAREFLSKNSGIAQSDIGVIVTDLAGEILAKDDNAEEILREMNELTEITI